MTRDDVKEVAKVAGKEAAISTLIALGIDAENPTEVQKDFIHLRWWREVMQAVTKTAIVTGSIAFLGALGSFVGLGLRAHLWP